MTVMDAASLPPSSGRQRQRPEFLSSRAKAAKLIDRCASRRERERGEWLRQHLVQIRFRSDADRHVWIKPLTRRVSNKMGDVADKRFLDVAAAFVAEERRRGSGVHDVGFNGRNEFILQPMQVF